MLGKNIKFFHILAIALVAMFVLFAIPVPNGLSKEGWHMLILFVSTMVGVMLEVIPFSGTLFLSLLVASLTGVIDLKTQGFSGFSNVVPWLLFFVLALSRSIIKSTIGLRIGYFFMKKFGKNILGLAYSVSASELVLSPILPSNTARGASLGMPVVTSLAQYVGNNVKNVSEKTVGGFLALVYTSSNSVCSCLFMTAMISNAIIVDVVQKQCGFEISWLAWLSYTAIPCLTILLCIPIILYFLTPPKVGDLRIIQKEAAEKLQELGKLTKDEKIILSTFCGMLVMWILSDVINVSILTTTILGVCLFLFFGVFNVKDLLSDHSSLSAVIMLGVLISYVNCMSEYGVITWFNEAVRGVVYSYPQWLRLYVLSISYLLTHYFFSGEGARIIALYAPFLLTGLAIGINQMQMIFTLTVFSAFSDMLAHYTCPSSILMFSNGYVSVKKWMSIGIVLVGFSAFVWFAYSYMRF